MWYDYSLYIADRYRVSYHHWPERLQIMAVLRCQTLIVMSLITASAEWLVVDRAKQGLAVVPTDIDPKVTFLKLSSNHITRIEDEDLSGLRWLQRLFIGGNAINFIGANAFANNTYLSVLNFAIHRLSIFPAEVGGAWCNIVTIIGSMGPVDMHPVHFIHLPALQILIINTNSVKNLTIGSLPSLKKLHANWCKLKTFPNLTGAPNLEVVSLKSNSFTHIPQPAISGLVNLRILSLSDGGVNFLPDFSHLVSLEALYIKNNALTSLPDLYHLPLTGVNWYDNPVVCDQAMCWVRMWSSTKPAIIPANLETGTCGAPEEVCGLPLMSVHPVSMECYKGKCSWLL